MTERREITAELLAYLRSKPADRRMQEAAELIEQLQAENQRLRKWAGIDGDQVAPYRPGDGRPR